MPVRGAAGPAILVVEDEPALAHLIERVLREEGYLPHLEFSGHAGLAAGMSAEPDAVVLDLALPDIDGLEVCRRLRGAGLRAPVIMLTARDAVSDRVSGLDAGADDYLVKPFAFEELLARIRAQLRREQPRGGQLQAGELLLDPTRREARLAGRPLQLTDQEFRLLELFMRHPGQVLTRERILERIWGYAADPRSNVVDIYIHYLRDKLGRERGQAMIRTVRSVGYMLNR
ncbi:MAG: response regulator transcription factor [Candidatus Dormibacteraceae bacterium]